MLALPSLQKEYALCFSYDPAFDLPDVPDLTEDASSEEVALFEKANAAREELLRVPRATGDWSSVTKPNAQPTRFIFRQVHGNLLSWWRGEKARRNLDAIEGLELMFRIACTRVENCGDFHIKHDDGRPQLVSIPTLNALYAFGHDIGKAKLGRSLVLELGAVVLKRAIEGCPPLS